MTSVVKEAVVRRIGDTNGFELLLDGEVFPFHLDRQDIEVIDKLPGDKDPLLVMYLPVFVEKVVGAAEFNEFLAEEADRSRVRYADQRDLGADRLETMHSIHNVTSTTVGAR